jgi:hypothetical protein
VEKKKRSNPGGSYVRLRITKPMETRLPAQTKTVRPPSFTAVANGRLQRKCACGGPAGLAGECEGCGKQSLSLQRSTRNSAAETQTSGEAPPIVHEVLRSSGRPLDEQTRAFFEPRLGHDFSKVRVHDDTHAAQSAEAVNALAYTVRNDVVFGSGRYQPETIAGKRLLAHELTHVTQQNPSGIYRQSPGSEAGNAEEQQAEKTADAVAAPAEQSPQAEPMAGGGGSKLTAAQVTALITSNNKSSASTEVLLCLIWKESGFVPTVKNSTSSATGLMQMTKGAVKQVNESTPKGVHFEHSEMTDAAKNIECGTYYVKIRMDWAGGDLKKGLEGFGTGAGYADKILTCESCVQATPAKTDECLKAIHT